MIAIPGAVMTMGYDALLRPTRTKSQAINQGNTQGTPQAPIGNIIQDTSLNYNDVSNIIKRETEHGIYTYGYDDLDRLTQVVPPSSINFNTANTATFTPSLPIESYTYDAVHNRLSSLHQTGSLTNAWQYNAHHQLTQYGDPTATSTSSLTSIVHPKVIQTYNANGHLITKTVTPEDLSPQGIQTGKQSHRYTYSVSERLLQTNDGTTANSGQGNEIARYAYDPFGRRIKKTVSQNLSGQGGNGSNNATTIGTTIYFYGDEGLMAEVDNTGTITTTYGWTPNGTWGTAPQWKRDHAGQSGATNPQGDASTNGIEHYYHVDHLGTSQRLTNAQGEITWRAVSEAFGRTVVDVTLTPTATGTTTNNLRFPGQYEDLETATRQNWNRDYGANVGRYLQGDPIGLDGGINTYAYVEVNPVGLIDPRGEFPGLIGAAGAGAFNLAVQVMKNYMKNGGNLAAAFQCVNLGEVAASAAVGLFIPGGFTAVQKGLKFLRGGSATRFAAATTLAVGVAAPTAIGIGSVIPEIPLNRVVPSFGTDCTCGVN